MHVVEAVRAGRRANAGVATATSPEEWARVNARGRADRVVDVRPLFAGTAPPGRGEADGAGGRVPPPSVDAPSIGDRPVREWSGASTTELM